METLSRQCGDQTKEKLGHHVLAYFVNDGKSLDKIRSNSQDLVFSWDSFVHMHRNVIDEYLKADVLFLHLNDYPAFEKVLPSKLFEYAAFNKPIFAGLSGYSADFINAEISDCEVFRPCDTDDAVKKFERIKLAVKPRIKFIEKFKRETIMTMMAASVLKVLNDNA